MTVDFALFVSPEGIALAHRQAAGHWALVGESPFDVGTLDAEMARLKAAADARGAAQGAKPKILLVLPDDQILYTSFMAPANDPALVTQRITEGLDGMTPYAVPDLAYDWRAVEEDRVKVAVVAKETLEEAAAFASGHGFETAGFAAMPPAERYPGMPLFGDTRPDLPGLDGGMAFGSDDWVDPTTVAEAPPAEIAPSPEIPPASDAAADGSDAPAPVAKPLPDNTPSDSKSADAPVAKDKAPAPAADPAPPEAAPSPDADTHSTTPPAADAQGDEDAEPDDAPPAPIADPTLDRPIESIVEDETRDAKAEQQREPPTPEVTDKDSAAEQRPTRSDIPELPEPEAPAAESHEDRDVSATTPVEPPAPQAPVASRGKAERPGGKAAPSLTAKKPGGSQARQTRFTPSLPEAGGETEENDTTSETPALRFGAQRGKAARPDSDTGQLLSTRRSRIGFGAPADSTPPVLHPDTALPPRAETQPASEASKPPGKLAAQLARVREASKARPKVEPPPPARPTEPSPLARAIADPVPGGAERGASASDTSAGADAGTSGLSASMFRRRSTKPSKPSPEASNPAPPTATTTADTAFTSGLLARKPTETAGPSFKTGLILTLILLILLALIAVWSVLFLPDSPMARLFSGGSNRETALLDDRPLDGPAPPAAFSAPPAIGALDTGAADAERGEAEADISSEIAAPATAVPDAPLQDPPPEAVAALPAPETLPDIDADLDLAPLPPLPEDLLPSREETERIYAEDGIWPRTPDRPSFEPFQIVDDTYLASIDPEVTAFDAVALSDPGINPGELLRRVPPPPPFGAEITRDARGLVAATPEGVLTPEGAFVVLGRPPVDAIPRPREVAPAIPETPVLDADEAVLGTFTPSPRPADLDETRERQLLGGLSRTELAGLRPGPRPLSAQESAAQASLFPQQQSPGDAADPVAQNITGTPLAVTSSRLPRSRPAEIETIVAAAARVPATAVAATAVAPPPSIPSNADVSRAATESNAIRLRDINLIGVTGSSSNRRALVRLPSGRFVRVGVGDRLDGGRVAAIGEASLQYVRNGRNVTLEIPG